MRRFGRYTNVAAMGGLLNPLEIMGANLVGWWNADSAAKITTTGSGVSSWLDEIANIDMVQATDADRPQWSATSFNGRGGVTFDGVSEYLRVLAQPASFPITTATSELWVILDQLVGAGDTVAKHVFNYGGLGGAANARRILRLVSSGVNRMQISASGSSPSNANVDFSGRHYLRGVFVNGAIRPDIDANAGTGGAPTLNTDTQYVSLCANTSATPTIFLNAIVHQAFVLDATPSAGQLAALNAYCASRV